MKKEMKKIDLMMNNRKVELERQDRKNFISIYFYS